MLGQWWAGQRCQRPFLFGQRRAGQRSHSRGVVLGQRRVEQHGQRHLVLSGGGNQNEASGDGSSVSGGQGNQPDELYTSISGGLNRSIPFGEVFEGAWRAGRWIAETPSRRTVISWTPFGVTSYDGDPRIITTWVAVSLIKCNKRGLASPVPFVSSAIMKTLCSLLRFTYTSKRPLAELSGCVLHRNPLSQSPKGLVEVELDRPT